MLRTFQMPLAELVTQLKKRQSQRGCRGRGKVSQRLQQGRSKVGDRLLHKISPRQSFDMHKRLAETDFNC